MRALDRKLLRDLTRMRGQLLSIAAVVGCGIAAVVAMGSTLLTIQRTRDAFYERARFADVFAALTRAPEPLAARLRAIPGVTAVATRVTASAVLDVPGRTVPATGYIVSVDPGDASATIDRLYLRSGRMVGRSSENEVVIGEHFADANTLRPGDSLGAVINGRWQRLHIVGVAISPEFVHDIAPGATGFTDSRQFGILWMHRDVLGPLYGMDGAFNDVALTLAPGASEKQVIARVDALLTPYGGGHAYGRDDQPSNRVVVGETAQLRAFGVVMPAIFLAVAAFLIDIVLSRLVATQRAEIATLKAFGYEPRAIAMHFVGYGVAAVAAGTVIGIPLGAWVGAKYTGLYKPYFRFPDFHHQTSVGLVLLAVGVSVLAAVLGALGAVRSAASLPPAEGMRPPSPAVYRPLLVERLGFGAGIASSVRMVLRTVEHRPLRTLASIAGVALAAAVLVGGIFAFDVAMWMGRVQFEVAEREDIAVTFARPRPMRARQELRAVRGVRLVEPFRTVAVRIRAGQHWRRIPIMGLGSGSTLRRLVDGEGRPHRLPPTGLVMSRALADILHVSRGDTVTVELFERGGATRRVVVVAVLDELFGLWGYMEIGALNRLVGEGPVISGAYLALEPGAESHALDVLAHIPGVASASSRRGMLESFERMISQNITLTTTVVSILAAVIAVGVLYNGARIALSERGRELASLRVLGFTQREVAALLFGEQGAIDLVGTPVGLVLGLGLAWLIAHAFGSEVYRFPVMVSARTYMSAVAVVVAASVLAGVAMRRRLNALSMVEVLKAPE